jgi:hypothetical protein
LQALEIWFRLSLPLDDVQNLRRVNYFGGKTKVSVKYDGPSNDTMWKFREIFAASVTSGIASIIS